MLRAQYDVVVIGSSPLLMLAAIQWRRAGKSVLLVEAADALGGAWRIDRCAVGAQSFAHECACHLVEWYAGGYGLLQNLSSYPFVRLTPQPVKVWNSGRVENYLSRSSIVRDYVLSLRSLVIVLLKLGAACLGIGNSSVGTRWRALAEALVRIRFASRYRLPGLAQFGGLQGPERGFAEFVIHLHAQLERAGVDVARGRVLTLEEEEPTVVVCDDGSRIRCGKTILGESAELRSSGAEQGKNRTKGYHHVLISLPAAQVVARNSYVHFVDHAVFHRMTFVQDVRDADGAPLSFFLVQLRQPYEALASFADELGNVFSLYQTARGVDGLKVWKVIDGVYVPSRVDSVWQHYAGHNPALVRTIGDLARNAVLLNRTAALPPGAGTKVSQ